MDIENLKAFFKLGDNSSLLKIALSPRSCGGGVEFDNLALEGDKIMDIALIEMFKQQGETDITLKKATFHNERTLSLIGDYFQLKDLMKPTDRNAQIQKNDLKETVEALIGASFHQNGREIVAGIVQALYKLAVDEDFLDIDFISKLYQLLQKEKDYIQPTWHEAQRVGGPEHRKIWKVTADVQYRGEQFTETSDPFTDTAIAKRDVAQKLLQLILGIPITEVKRLTELPTKQQAEIRVRQSVLERKLVFSKAETGEGASDIERVPLKVDSNTGETIPEWAMRKAKKNPFGMLLILTGLIPNVRGASWSCSLDVGELVLINLEIAGDKFFEVGYGTSKNQARRDAANKIIDNSNLFAWLARNHRDSLK